MPGDIDVAVEIGPRIRVSGSEMYNDRNTGEMFEQLADRRDRSVIPGEEECCRVRVDCVASARPRHGRLGACLCCFSPRRRDARFVQHHVEVKSSDCASNRKGPKLRTHWGPLGSGSYLLWVEGRM